MGLILAFCVSEAWARGGRGGGGRSISRGGSASRGSFGGGSRGGLGSQGSYSRQRPSSGSLGGFSRQPARNPSQRPSTGARPSTRPSTGQTPARPSALPGGGQAAQRPTAGTRERPAQADAGTRERPSERPERGEGDREGAREDWQQHRQDMQDDRQQAASDRQYERQEYGEDYWEEGGGAYWHGGVWVGGWDEVTVIHIDDDEAEWSGVVAGFMFGSVISAATFQNATTKSGCELSEVDVNGETYFHCGDTWYSRAMQGGEVRYLVVAPPPGF
jgi:hypothetical protein